MGQQQLLLIILGVIIVGIAVAVGITMFQDNALSANKDAVTNDLVNLAAKAQQFYRKPVALGGGGNSFSLITNVSQLVSSAFYNNDNGQYSIVGSSATDITMLGIGKTLDATGQYPQVSMIVTASTYGLQGWTEAAALIY